MPAYAYCAAQFFIEAAGGELLPKREINAAMQYARRDVNLGGRLPIEPRMVAEQAAPQRRDDPKRDKGKGGAWGRIRTTDTRIFNPLLYQLSYPGEGRRRGEPRL